MSLIQTINIISEEAKNKFRPDLKKYGKNFRAISESAVLEVLNPLFKNYNIGYEVEVKEKNLTIEKVKCGIDAAGNLVEKLIFVAECVVGLTVFSEDKLDYIRFEGWGSGLDAGDKATGKAITAAVKYALFKGFRLQYSDDPDADGSEEIENIVKKKESTEKVSGDKKKTSTEAKEEPLATQAQLNYIYGLVEELNLSDTKFKSKYGYLPTDPNMPMRKAREILKDLEKIKQEDPFL